MGLLKNENYAESTLGANILIGDLALDVATGEGSLFPATGYFMLAIWGSGYASPALDSTRELVKATLTAGDTFAITRGQEGTSAKGWSISDKVALVLTAGKLDELEKYTQNEAMAFGFATGTNTYAVVLDPIPTAYVDGFIVRCEFSNESTGASTLNANGLGARKIYGMKNSILSQLDDGDLLADAIYVFVYDSNLDGATGGWHAVTFNYINSAIDVSSFPWFLDEDAMGSDSAVKLASQQSIKAYVDDTITALSLGDASTKTVGTGDAHLVLGINVTRNVDTDVSANGWVIDEDDLASDDDTKVPTQQSVKAAIDAVETTTYGIIYKCPMTVDAGDTDHDINIGAGFATLFNGTSYKTFTYSDITKQIDAVWAAGDDAGGLAAEDSLTASTWYYIRLIGKADGTADVIFYDQKAVGSLPATYTYSFLHGAFKTDVSANIDADTLIIAGPNEDFAGAVLQAQEEQTQNTSPNPINGANNTWVSRTLNTLKLNFIPGAEVNLSTYLISLPPGKYDVEGRCSAYETEYSQAIFYNNTDANEDIIGKSIWISSSGRSGEPEVKGRLDISTNKDFYLQMNASAASSGTAYGEKCNRTTEVYSQLWITVIELY